MMKCSILATLRPLGIFIVSFLLLLPPAWALDAFEVQVYSAALNAPRQATVELHLNYPAVGGKQPEYAGQLSRQGMAHMATEFAYGVAPAWELGAYVQAAVSRHAKLYYGGAKLRAKFVVPAAQAGPLQLGINIEASHIPVQFEASAWGGEIRPILGYADATWVALLNPIVEFNFSGPSKSVEFSPAVKVARTVSAHWAVGPEYYVGLGPFASLQTLQAPEQTLYAAVDLLDGPVEFNAGVGVGFGPQSQRLMLKMIVGTRLPL
jgi:hypothetical protein